MNFTNIASFTAILVASVQAAEIKSDSLICTLPGSKSTNIDTTTNQAPISIVGDSKADKTDIISQGQILGTSSQIKTVENTVQTPVSTAIDLSTVTPDSPVEHKVKKILSLNLQKFGDLNQGLVQSFLKPEEWGRIDYHSNDDLLTEEALVRVISKPSSSLSSEDKASRIMALKPTPQKIGDLKAEMVTGILTPEEWGKVDFYDNDKPANEALITSILQQ